MNGPQAFIVRMTALADLVRTAYPAFQLSDHILELYEEQLKPLGYEAVCSAIDQIIVDRGSREPFPSIREIREVINPSVSPEAQAVEVANLIWSNIAKIGRYSTPTERDIGEVGLQVVKRYGSWRNLCEESDTASPTTMKAQLRETAKSVLERSSLGILDLKPALPDQQSKKVVALLEGVKEFPA